MPAFPRHGLLIVTGIVIALLGLALTAGGAWLAALGGSWYYVIAGLALVACGVQLARGNIWSLWIYAALVLGTLLWALWEVGIDWWPLAARGDVLFVLGLFLLTPWIRRRLEPPGLEAGALLSSQAPVQHGRIALAAALGLFLAVGVVSWFIDPHRVEGEFGGEPRGVVAAPAAGDEWTAYGGTGYGQRYSALAQITPDNVERLEQAWTYRTGDVRGREGDPEETTFQVTPLKIGNRLFLCTPHQSVIALDATTGEELWRYDPRVQDKLALQHLTCRGLSYYSGASVPGPGASAAGTAAAPQPAAANPGQTAAANPGQPVAAHDGKTSAYCSSKLFMPTADGRIIALNPEDGGVCLDFGSGTGQINLWRNMPNVKPGSYYSTSPVVVARGLIIVGGTVLDNVSVNEASGVIRAFDIRTGRLVWNWDSGNPDDTAPIAEGRTYTPNSPNSWSISSVDEELGMVYVPLGNQPPDQWGGNRSENVERYSSSLVALDLETGRVRWSFQTVHHDLWDYDVPSQPSLIDLNVGGETVPALVQPTKQGELYVLDRRTGRPLLPVTEKPVPQGAAQGDHTAATQPVSALSFDPPPLTGADMWGATMFDQLVCRIRFHQLRYEGRYTPPSTRGSLIYPGNFGVFNWGSIAVDPQRQMAFTTPTYLAFISQLVPRQDDTSLYVQGGQRPHDSLPSLNENFGAPFAVKLSAFTSALGLPCQAPPWGYVAGADLRTGRIVWKHKNGTVRDSSPLPLPFRMGVPNLGGPIITAGGVAFLSGTLDYYVRAYDVRNGRQLWRSRLPAGGQATPMTYTGEDGRQYLLVVAGGHGSLGTKAGDHVIAYALPKQ
ncbi:MAG: glucose/quinate/shikimate family membrane-bound PQQ-dependent dehydrogenase [Pigmentiphaga sp.]|uniref:glucose/quinate/shikimate family membrane-bound PQQ-dependent dehydrogenase n=1 Tax=Pigmentiphaga sp. TaxID=1977564 RepID=UPI0029B08B4B|nr:glucose/quinate/shikimate family membrane-bound PQQ-dependent dehydrogenase [Pigmentiphaga sp.]MDX3905865.1 glucose/quinate/shikimate family membrane-bound PQQ-dependent dehydrogenase [Pigmentiphaga sp.]